MSNTCVFVTLQADDEKAILSNVHGSSRYTEFMLGLGELVQLEDVDQSRVYLGGLSYPMDGKFACTWKDESMQGMTFKD